MTYASVIEHCVYGPVPSRRLGRSLGVDLVPFKTCTYDCVYCQLGHTTRKIARRRRWLDPAEVIAAVRDKLDTEPDVIALAGSGEPTLDARIGEVITGVKQITPIPVAVITNGSLLSRPAVRRDLADADIVLPSLDAPSADLFGLVNRPHPSVRFSDLVGGLIALRKEHRGEMWLEVLLLDGVTGIEAEVRKLAVIASRIAPDRIQLTTVVRPPADPFVEPVAAETLQRVAGLFTPVAEVVVEAAPAVGGRAAVAADVLALLARRPCTADDIAAGLGIHRNEALKAATALVAEGSVRQLTHDGRAFYTLVPDIPDASTQPDINDGSTQEES
jgi:wyosine [tRNA(Phe)-imidazoG37] synthetase (radical SAM superfamily)